MILAPIVRGRKGAFRKELEKFAQDGYVRVRINGELFPLDDFPALDKRKNHTIEIVVDRLLVKQGIAARLEQSIATALKLAGGLVTVAIRSEEHTSELQSRLHLVCRLLLEKKKSPRLKHRIILPSFTPLQLLLIFRLTSGLCLVVSSSVELQSLDAFSHSV